MSESFTQAVQTDGKAAIDSPTAASAEWHPLLLKHLGTWEGVYRKINAKTGETTDIHRSKLDIGVRGNRYSQRNTYTWDDGRVEEYIFPGRLLDGKFTIESERIWGVSIVLLEDTVAFYGKYKELPIDVIDIIRLITPTKRARTWQVRSGDDIVEIVHVEEEKTSTEDMYFEIVETLRD